MERLEFKRQMKGMIGAIPVCALITICLEVGLAFLHRGGSVEKHLIHFVILLLAAEGMVLLYGAVPSVRRIWARIDREWWSAETRKPWVDIVYAALAILMMVHHFYVILYYPELPTGATRFAPAWIPFAVITVLTGKLWRDKGFWLGAVLAAYLFERTYLKNPDITGETMVYMVFVIYALVLCYGVFHVIRPQYRRTALRILCAIWTLATLAYCAPGLYYKWTAIKVSNLGTGVTTVTQSRGLKIFANSNITACIIAGGALFSLTGFFTARNGVSKALYLAACFPMLVTNSLTYSRSCRYMLSFAIAGMVTLGIWGVLKKRVKITGRRNILLAACLAVCMAGCFLGAAAGQKSLEKVFKSLKENGGFIMSTAQAETNETILKKEPAEKDEIDDNGRRDIWNDAFHYIREHPGTLALGMSADGSVRTAIGRDDHCHNILIQILMEGGIPGIGLFLGLLAYFFFHACRLWMKWDLPMWKRALPLPVLAVMMMEMVDCLTHFAYGHVPMTVLYFFMGSTVAVSRSLQGAIEKQQAE